MKVFTLFKRNVFVVLLICSIMPLYSQSINWERTNPSLSDVVTKITIKTDGTMYVGTFSGAYRSSDNGSNWTNISNGLIDKDSAKLKVFSIAYTNNGVLLAGTSGGGIFRSSNNGDSWTAANNNLGNLYINAVTVNPYNGQIYAGSLYTGIYRSTDNGDSWQHITPDTIYAINDILVKPTGEILAAGSSGIYRSNDGGKTWMKRIKNMGEKPNVYTLAMKSTGEVYAGTRDGKVYVSTNSGDSWTETLSIGSNTQIFSLAARSNGDIFAGSYGMGVYFLPNGTSKWIQVNEGLGTFRIYALAVHPDGDIYAGTFSMGVYRGVQALISVAFSGSYCEGSDISIPFTAVMTFNKNNVFTAQLSNSSGGFAKPVDIGSVTGTTSGVINAKLPKGIAQGTGYRIRVVSSDPVSTGTNNGIDISIFKFPTPNIKGAENACENTLMSYSSETPSYNTYKFKWTVTGGSIVGPDDQSIVQVLWNGVGKGSLSVVQINGVSGCEDSLKRVLQILPIPSTKPTITKDGDNLISSIPGKNQWYLNGEKIPNAVDQTYNPRESGKYTVQSIGENGCPSPMSDPFDFVSGIIDYPTASASGLNIYPNPASSTVNIDFTTERAGMADIEILSLVGEPLIRSSFTVEQGRTQKTFDINSLPDGMYLVRLVQDGRIETRTVVKVR